MEDIEDLQTTASIPSPGQSRVSVNRRVRPQKLLQQDFSSNDSVLPESHKIWVKTWGCSHNNSDSEYMAGQLAAYGYQITDDSESADLWLLNSCTVKGPSEDHFRNEVTRARKMDRAIVVSGCVPQGEQDAGYLKGISAVGVQQIDRVVEVVEETLKGNTVRLMGTKKIDGKKAGGASLELPKIRRNPLIEIISVNTGCLNACTYCKTKHARGELGSYPPDQIVARAKQAFSEGVVELWLTSEDTGAYGRDIGATLPQLLWQLVEVIPEGAMMRVGMTNPPYILEHLEEMAKVLAHPRVYSFLHVPVQSGSDSVLMDMRREYCQQDFRDVVDLLKDRVPGVTIATDLICGFPTETEEDFQETLDLVRDYKFPVLYTNQFFPRPGTVAARMPPLNRQMIKKRTKRVSELFQAYRPYDHKLGERQQVLVTEVSHDKKHYVGHNKFYEQVLLPLEEQYLGRVVTVDIVDTGKHYLVGRPVDKETHRPEGVPPPLPAGQVSWQAMKEVKTSSSSGLPKSPFAQVLLVLLALALLYRLYLLLNVSAYAV